VRRLALLAIVAASLSAAAARAGDVPSVIANELSQKFVTACEAGKVSEALALYLDDAVVVFPSEGGRANGKAELAKLLSETCGVDTGKSKWLGGAAPGSAPARTPSWRRCLGNERRGPRRQACERHRAHHRAAREDARRLEVPA
jgi:hypothetical protein